MTLLLLLLWCGCRSQCAYDEYAFVTSANEPIPMKDAIVIEEIKAVSMVGDLWDLLRFSGIPTFRNFPNLKWSKRAILDSDVIDNTVRLPKPWIHKVYIFQMYNNHPFIFVGERRASFSCDEAFRLTSITQLHDLLNDDKNTIQMRRDWERFLGLIILSSDCRLLSNEEIEQLRHYLHPSVSLRRLPCDDIKLKYLYQRATAHNITIDLDESLK